MLSTNYRLRLEAFCKDIASGTEVSMSDMIWATKLAKANTSARGITASPAKNKRAAAPGFRVGVQSHSQKVAQKKRF